jgi:hypothetical protein
MICIGQDSKSEHIAITELDMSNVNQFLYRGVNSELYQKNNGKLIPKSTNAFIYAFKYGDPEFKYGSGGSYGMSPANAALRHQLEQMGYPTSGISTTPHFERACVYATYGGVSGYVYKIDRELLERNGVTQWLVAKFVVSPFISEDEEVILVADDFGILPDKIVVEIIPID